MRRVIKAEEPHGFRDWKARENEDWKPTYGTLHNPEKQELHTNLLREQGFTCCYCGREIGLEDSHIEHFRPQSSYRGMALNYDNLFASCMRETLPGIPLICGHLKDEQFDESTFLSPLLPTIEDRFSYTLAGGVSGKDHHAERMVTILGLDKPFLTSRRAQAIQAVFDEEVLSALSEDELHRIAESFRRRGEDGRFGPFFHAVARFAEDLIQLMPREAEPRVRNLRADGPLGEPEVQESGP